MEEEFWAEQEDPAAERQRRAAAARDRHEKLWKPPSEQAEGSESVYRMNFGKHSTGKGKTVAEVLAKDPEYFKHLVSAHGDILTARPDLRAALAKEGVLDDLLEQRPALQRARAQRVLQAAEDRLALREAGQEEKEEHPEVKKLRFLQQAEASAVLQSGAEPAAARAVVALCQDASGKQKKAGAALPETNASGSFASLCCLWLHKAQENLLPPQELTGRWCACQEPSGSCLG